MDSGASEVSWETSIPTYHILPFSRMCFVCTNTLCLAGTLNSFNLLTQRVLDQILRVYDTVPRSLCRLEANSGRRRYEAYTHIWYKYTPPHRKTQRRPLLISQHLPPHSHPILSPSLHP